MAQSNESAAVPRLRWLQRAPEGIDAGMASPRLGVLSGTFNPPTRAHLQLARAARDQLRLQEVLFVLPEVPPHKEGLEASLEDRSEMLRRAVEADPRFSAAIASHGLFVDIHRALAPHYPSNARLVFLAGCDAAERILVRWPYPDIRAALAEMFGRFDLGVAARGGALELPPDAPAAQYRTQIHSIALPDKYQEISATLLRERLGHGKDIQELAPAEVVEVILARGLYR